MCLHILHTWEAIIFSLPKNLVRAPLQYCTYHIFLEILTSFGCNRGNIGFLAVSSSRHTSCEQGGRTETGQIPPLLVPVDKSNTPLAACRIPSLVLMAKFEYWWLPSSFQFVFLRRAWLQRQWASGTRSVTLSSHSPSTPYVNKEVEFKWSKPLPWQFWSAYTIDGVNGKVWVWTAAEQFSVCVAA